MEEHAAGRITIFPVLIAVCFVFVGCNVAAQTFDDVTEQTLTSGVKVYRIDRPDPRIPGPRPYVQVVLPAGARFTVNAGGCVQTGGRGLTWKHYAFPLGRMSERYYSGVMRIVGVTPGNGITRIGAWLNRQLENRHKTNTVLELGYQDDNYNDNGYGNHDDGNDDQCKDTGPAWVTVTISPPGEPSTSVGPRYNEVHAKSVHNAYEKENAAITDFLERDRFRSLEIDIHASNKVRGWPTLRGDWYVYHNAIFLPFSNCRKFSDCLSELRKFQQRHPQHELITLFVDLKDKFGSDALRTADLFDTLLRDTLHDLYAPNDHDDNCAREEVVRESIGYCPWPLLADLRGKFIVVLTGNNDDLFSYAGWRPGRAVTPVATRAAFVAPEVSSWSQVLQMPLASMINLDAGEAGRLALGERLIATGRVTRAYTFDGEALWDSGIQNHIHLLATDEVGPRPASWASTENAYGWPFTCMFADCSQYSADAP